MREKGSDGNRERGGKRKETGMEKSVKGDRITKKETETGSETERERADTVEMTKSTRIFWQKEHIGKSVYVCAIGPEPNITPPISLSIKELLIFF